MRCWLASPGSQQRRHGQASAWRSAYDAARMLLAPHAGKALCPAIRQLQSNNTQKGSMIKNKTSKPCHQVYFASSAYFASMPSKSVMAERAAASSASALDSLSWSSALTLSGVLS